MKKMMPAIGIPALAFENILVYHILIGCFFLKEKEE